MHRRLAIAFVVILALAAAPVASATIEGPCEATIAGEDVVARDTFARSDAISVPQTGGVPVTMTAERPIDNLKLEIEFAGFKYTVLDEPTTVRQSTGVVPVDDYAKYGIGLYKIVGTATGEGFTCEATALVDVQGNPLETAAGAIAVGMVVVGGLGVFSFLLRGGRPGLAMVLAAFLGLILASRDRGSPAGVRLVLPHARRIDPRSRRRCRGRLPCRGVRVARLRLGLSRERPV